MACYRFEFFQPVNGFTLRFPVGIARLRRWRGHLPEYLAFQAPRGVMLLCFWWFYRHCVPARQDAPILVYTMGKVGTITLEQSLRSSGFYFTFATHRMELWIRGYPCFTRAEWRMIRLQGLLHLTGLCWLARLPRLRVVTAVREPIARLISLYLFSYRPLFGEPVGEASMETLLGRFPRLLEKEYVHPLIPGEFFSREIGGHLGIDIYAHPFDAAAGWSVIEQDNLSLLILKSEMPDEAKIAACRRWLRRDVTMTRRNTAEDGAYGGGLYAEFKRRVRIPRRLAEALYRSRYMHHFYTAEERETFWRRWEPQLDASLPVPAWMEAELQEYHPPMAGA